MATQRDIYIAIMSAADRGDGIRLSWEEVCDLSLDDAISTRALNGLEEAEYQKVQGCGWKSVDPRKARCAFNGTMRSDIEYEEQMRLIRQREAEQRSSV